ncbi:MAG: hypothetical protein LBE35_08060 [Clostridiales bacterium]|jgi:hypothetical protein|nr:hypothetical protein [Clostridiales bacterium]
MVLDKLEYIVSLLAGLGVAIGGFAAGQELPTVLLHLFIALIVFYIIGLIIRIYLRAKVFPIPVEEELLEGEEEELFDEEGNPILALQSEEGEGGEIGIDDTVSTVKTFLAQDEKG